MSMHRRTAAMAAWVRRDSLAVSATPRRCTAAAAFSGAVMARYWKPKAPPANILGFQGEASTSDCMRKG